ncbi:hypothetical protein N0V90_003581 [Kalmusia sp. IMI 367209]|nr:hypothetical protein N0V90_003581 [Kalmusia sp. IMI 367209]
MDAIIECLQNVEVSVTAFGKSIEDTTGDIAAVYKAVSYVASKLQPMQENAENFEAIKHDVNNIMAFVKLVSKHFHNYPIKETLQALRDDIERIQEVVSIGFHDTVKIKDMKSIKDVVDIVVGHTSRIKKMDDIAHDVGAITSWTHMHDNIHGMLVEHNDQIINVNDAVVEARREIIQDIAATHKTVSNIECMMDEMADEMEATNRRVKATEEGTATEIENLNNLANTWENLTSALNDNSMAMQDVKESLQIVVENARNSMDIEKMLDEIVKNNATNTKKVLDKISESTKGLESIKDNLSSIQESLTDACNSIDQVEANTGRVTEITEGFQEIKEALSRFYVSIQDLTIRNSSQTESMIALKSAVDRLSAWMKTVNHANSTEIKQYVKEIVGSLKTLDEIQIALATTLSTDVSEDTSAVVSLKDIKEILDSIASDVEDIEFRMVSMESKIHDVNATVSDTFAT